MATRRSRPRRPRWPWLLAGGLLVLLALIAVLAYTGLRARSELNTAQARVHQLRHDLLSQQPGAAAAQIAAIQSEAAAAQGNTSGPLWAALRALPVLGPPARTVSGAARGVDALARQVLPAVATADQFLGGGHLHAAGGTIPLAPFEQAAAPLATAASRASAVEADLSALPRHTVAGFVDRARGRLTATLHSLTGELTAAADTARLLPGMLGAHGTRRYFLGFENDAEARGLGGLPGAFAVVTADHGHLAFERFGNDVFLNPQAAGPPVNAGVSAAYLQRYAADAPTRIFVNSDVSPNFPYTARIWMAMWQARTGQHLDGAIATDPTALSYLLGVTGPTTLADGTRISARTVVNLTESAAYARFSSVTARKAFFLTVAQAAAADILHGTAGHATALGHALATAVGQRRLLIYSGHPAEQAVLARQPVAGLVARTTAPFTGLVVNNAAGSKLDYYLGRSLTYTTSGCGPHIRLSTVTVKLVNNAPTSGLPPYVVARADHQGAGLAPGTERLLATIYATAGAQLTGASLAGRPALLAPGSERGHPTFTADLELAPQASATLVLHLQEPASAGAPVVLPQPLVRPEVITTHLTPCS